MKHIHFYCIHSIEMLLRTSSMLLISKYIFRRNHTLINHKIYPLHDRESTAYKQLVLNSREEFDSTGCLYLPSFFNNIKLFQLFLMK